MAAGTTSRAMRLALDQGRDAAHRIAYEPMNAQTGYGSGICAVVGCLLLSSVQTLSAERAKVIAEAAEDYKDYCSACHGPSGRGDGEMASILVKRPSDLTRIAEPSGRFPFWRVYDVIAGVVSVPGHQTFQMPQYAKRFGADEHKPGYLPAHIRILLLTHYVEDLQNR